MEINSQVNVPSYNAGMTHIQLLSISLPTQHLVFGIVRNAVVQEIVIISFDVFMKTHTLKQLMKTLNDYHLNEMESRLQPLNTLELPTTTLMTNGLSQPIPCNEKS